MWTCLSVAIESLDDLFLPPPLPLSRPISDLLVYHALRDHIHMTSALGGGGGPLKVNIVREVEWILYRVTIQVVLGFC